MGHVLAEVQHRGDFLRADGRIMDAGADADSAAAGGCQLAGHVLRQGIFPMAGTGQQGKTGRRVVFGQGQGHGADVRLAAAQAGKPVPALPLQGKTEEQAPTTAQQAEKGYIRHGRSPWLVSKRAAQAVQAASPAV